MEFQILKIYKIGIFVLMLAFFACEKEIKLNLPPSEQQWVVEASINQRFFNLNYVFISSTLDYFKPDLSLNGIKGAKVFITQGEIINNDTVFDVNNRIEYTNYFDTLIPGIYINPFYMPVANKPYLLEITMPNGDFITGKTFIKEPPIIDSSYIRFEPNEKDTNAFLYFQWKDGPGQDNYRIAMWNYPDSFLIGWGEANRYYTLDDYLFNNTTRPFQFLTPFNYGDTINIYLSSIGRSEYIFWDSFRKAANNGGPFATPVTVKSNITGAIGSFTGYGLEFKQFILRY